MCSRIAEKRKNTDASVYASTEAAREAEESGEPGDDDARKKNEKMKNEK